MAFLFNALKEEVMGTVNDFKEKGVVGALSDAVLDARDMAVDGAGMLWDGVQQLVGDEDMLQDACLRCEGAPQAGGTFPLEFADGRILEATVVQVDGVSDPPRAVCTVPGFESPVLVPVLAPGVELPKADEAAEGEGNGFIDGLKQEWNATVQDFREKGAVGALKDATMDAVDIVGSTAKAGVNGARSMTNDLIDLDWSQETEKATNFVSSVSEKVAQHAEKVPVPKAMTENASWLVDSVKNEISATVQDFKEKGAVGAMKDAVLDAGDLVYTGATTAVEGAKSVAAPLAEQLPDLWSAENAAPAAAVGAAAVAGGAAAAAASSGGGYASAPVPKAPEAASSSSSSPVKSPEKKPEEEKKAQEKPESPKPTAKAPEAKPAEPVPETKMDEASADTPDSDKPKAGRKSLVSMRRNMFEKPKDTDKKQDEELID